MAVAELGFDWQNLACLRTAVPAKVLSRSAIVIADLPLLFLMAWEELVDGDSGYANPRAQYNTPIEEGTALRCSSPPPGRAGGVVSTMLLGVALCKMRLLSSPVEMAGGTPVRLFTEDATARALEAAGTAHLRNLGSAGHF